MGKVIRRPGNGQVGVTPTIQNKILHTNQKLGVNLKGQQGAAFNIYDTVVIATSTKRQTVSFFSQTSNKSMNFTNLQSGFLQAGESLGVQYLSFALLTLSGTDLTQDTTSVSAVNPITANVPLLMGTASLVLANGTMYKDYLAIEAHPSFNPDTAGVTNFNATAVDALIGVSRIRLDANPVIPPNMKFRLDFSFGPITVSGNVGLLCVLGRTGSIFSPKTPL
jgi:hypothetical protein